MWLREDGTPYYVGKGSGKRAFIRNNHLCNPPKDRSRIILQEWPSEAEAIEGEKFLISFYGKKEAGGLLHNFTDGGDGISGWHHTQEVRERIRRANFGNRHSEGHKNHIVPHATVTRLKMSASHIGLKDSIETRRKKSLSAQKRHEKARIFAKRG